MLAHSKLKIFRTHINKTTDKLKTSTLYYTLNQHLHYKKGFAFRDILSLFRIDIWWL